MRYRQRSRVRTPRGKLLVMTAILMPVLTGCLAIAVDIAVVATARSALPNAAGAAALAGVMQLATENRVRGSSDLSSEMANAQTQAIQLASLNSTLGQSTILLNNISNASGGDVVVGYLNPSVIGATLDTSTLSTRLYNSVQVNASRSSTNGGVVPSYFGRLVGNSGTYVRVTATATAQNYVIQGFKSTSRRSRLIPIALNVTMYNQMIAYPSLLADNYSYDSTTNTVISGKSDGIHESVLYPVPSGPGNWGTVNIGVTSNSTSTLSDQIRNGVTAAQLATYGGQLQLDPITQTLNFSGDPGLSAGIKDDLSSIIGQTVVIPLYDPLQSSGNGNNYNYTIVGFAAVRPMAVDFVGNPKLFIVQPALIDDPTAIAGAPQPDWTYGGLIRTHLSR